MKRFIKIPNNIFAYQLSPSALKVYCYLHSVSVSGAVVVKKATIGQRCSIASVTTVRKALCELQAKGLLSIHARHGRDGYHVASEYMLHSPSGRWFRLPAAALSYPKSAFSVYAYLCCAADNISRYAIPSLHTLATALHMAKNTVIQALALLVEQGIISKARKWAGKHNLYIVKAQKKRDSRLAERVSQATMIAFTRHHVVNSVASKTEDVKSAASLFCRVVQKLYNGYKTLLAAIEKRDKNSPIRYLPSKEQRRFRGKVRPSVGNYPAGPHGRNAKAGFPVLPRPSFSRFFFLWQKTVKPCIIGTKEGR